MITKIVTLLIISIVLIIGLILDLHWFYSPSVFELQFDAWLKLGAMPRLTGIMSFISDSIYGLWAIVAILAVYDLMRRHWREWIILSLSLAGLFIQFPVKEVFHRMRPAPEMGQIIFSGYGFPSGHSLTAIVLVGTLAFMYFDRTSKRANWWWLGLLYILLVGWSRIYLGAHFVSDVIGGYTFGLVYVLLLLGIRRLLVRITNSETASTVTGSETVA